MSDIPDWVLKEAAKRCDWHPSKTLAQMRGYLSSSAAFTALCRAIEQHEAFRQEVSDAVTALLDVFAGDSLSQGVINGHLHQFIIRKPDPLLEVIKAMRDEPTPYVNNEVYANRIHKKLDALGFEIREKNDD